MILFCTLASAFAGTLPKGGQYIYSGASYGTWSAFESKGLEKSLPQGAQISQILSHTRYSYGLKEGMEVAVFLPVASVSVSEMSVPTTTGIGQVGMASNFDLWGTDKLGVMGRVGLTTGALHAENRGKLTNIGDGSTQLHLGVAGSSVWEVSSAYVHVSARGGYIAKVPSTFDFNPKYPADDLTYGLNVGGRYKGYSLNVFVDGFYRLDGVDYPAPASVDSIEGFTALKASQMKVGISESVSWNNWTLSGYVATSVLAKNNPMDEVIGGIGIGYFIQP